MWPFNRRRKERERREHQALLAEAHEKYPELVRAHAPRAVWRVNVARVALSWFPDEDSLVAARQTYHPDNSLVDWVIPRARALAILEKAEALAARWETDSPP